MTAVGEITTNAPQNLGSEIQQRVLVGKEVGSNLAREARVANIGQVLGDPIGEQSASFPNIKHTTTGASDSIHHVGATASETPGHCELLLLSQTYGCRDLAHLPQTEGCKSIASFWLGTQMAVIGYLFRLAFLSGFLLRDGVTLG